MKISSDFAPPLKIISPFFILGSVFYILSTISLFFVDMGSEINDFFNVGVAHLLLVGFVITVIFGAMGQLAPVVLERGHSFVEFYYILPFLLGFGVALLSCGFWFDPIFLPFAGIFILIATLVYLADFFSTAQKSDRRSLSVTILRRSHILLFFGILAGIVLSFSFALGLNVDIDAFLKFHTLLAVGGCIFLIIVAIAIILLPMFGLSHGFGERGSKISLGAISAAIFALCLNYFLNAVLIDFIIVALLLLAAASFLYQTSKIYKKRMRKERDIWFTSLASAYFLLTASALSAICYFIFDDGDSLFLSSFLFGYGFLTLFITAHFYKIVPFLVWFERFSQLVGKEKVPMLHQMLPVRGSRFQLGFSMAGVCLSCVGIVANSDAIFKSGASFLFVGGVFLLSNLFWMLNFKRKSQ